MRVIIYVVDKSEISHNDFEEQVLQIARLVLIPNLK